MYKRYQFSFLNLFRTFQRQVTFWLVVELDGERAEKESIQCRIYSLKRNMKLLESERDLLEVKMNEAINSFSGMRQTLGKVRIEFFF